MPWQAVKQPNGLFAIWNQQTSAFVSMNLAEDQVVPQMVSLGMSPNEAPSRLASGKVDANLTDSTWPEQWKKNDLGRWHWCLMALLLAQNWEQVHAAIVQMLWAAAVPLLVGPGGEVKR